MNTENEVAMRTARGGQRPGRHRPGAVRPPWTSIPWDVRERAAAAGLDLVEPRWLVIYRTWARRFYAVSLTPVPGVPEVEARTVADLLERMREAESGCGVPGEQPRTRPIGAFTS
jgi:hypothetical protein